MADYGEVIWRILVPDSQNQAGLKAKYARYSEVAWKVRYDDAQAALEERQWEDALAQFNAIGPSPKPTGQAAEETRIGRALALEDSARTPRLRPKSRGPSNLVARPSTNVAEFRTAPLDQDRRSHSARRIAT